MNMWFYKFIMAPLVFLYVGKIFLGIYIYIKYMLLCYFEGPFYWSIYNTHQFWS